VGRARAARWISGARPLWLDEDGRARRRPPGRAGAGWRAMKPARVTYSAMACPNRAARGSA